MKSLIVPVNTTPTRALPARFRRQRLLIVGFGDVGARVAQQLPAGVRLLALTRDSERVDAIRRAGVLPLVGDLDVASTLRRLAGLAHRVLHLAPPAPHGTTDERTRRLLQALSRRRRPHSLVYVSTSGVYGDCGGAWVGEARTPVPQTPRAVRRLHAERLVRSWSAAGGLCASVLRVPGIYAHDRADAGPRARLAGRLPVLASSEDVYTNHIHADDLARACLRAVWLGRSQRVYNVNDDTTLKMGDYFDLAADVYRLERPPRMSRQDLARIVSPMQLSFMSESRRMRNDRLKRELRFALRYPTVVDGLRQSTP